MSMKILCFGVIRIVFGEHAEIKHVGIANLSEIFERKGLVGATLHSFRSVTYN